MAVFPYFTDQIRWAVLQRIVTVNRRKYTVLYPFTIFFSILLLPRIRIPSDIPFHAISSNGILQDIHSCSRYYCSMDASLITFWLFNRWYIPIYLFIYLFIDIMYLNKYLLLIWMLRLIQRKKKNFRYLLIISKFRLI